MLKYFLVIIMILCSKISFSQKCSKISIVYNEMKNETEKISPSIMVNSGCLLNIYQLISPNKTEHFFCIKIYTFSNSIPINSKGVFIKFEDNSVYLDTLKTPSIGYENGNYLVACVPFTREMYSKKIVKVQIDRYAVNIPEKYGKEFIKLANCEEFSLQLSALPNP